MKGPRYIKVKTRFEGFHSYPDAPERVAFLKNTHRHMFYIEATIEVFHDDRELEFFLVKEVLDKEIIIYVGLGDLGSCEMIGDKILDGLINTYGEKRYYSVEVSEDGENSGISTWHPDR